MKNYKWIKFFIMILIIVIFLIFFISTIKTEINKRDNEDIKTEMLTIEGKVKLAKAETEAKNIENVYGTKLTELNNDEIKKLMEKLQIQDYSNYYLLNESDLEKMQIKDLINKKDYNNFIVNYDNSDIIYIPGLKINKQIKYRISDIE